MAKKLKDVVKMNPEPARGKVGVDPTDPWSAKANIGESASLNQYLLSRGINPKFVSGDTKISHAKSSAFLKWKQNHQFESVESLSEDALLDKFLMSRGINPKYATKDMKISHAKSGQFIKWKRDHMFEEIQTEEVDKLDTLTFDIPLMIRMLELAREDVKDDMELHRITERLIEIRNKGTLTMDDYDFIAGIKKLKEEIEELAEGRMKDIAIDAAETQRLNKMTTLQKFRADSAARAKKHDTIEKKSGGMTSAIDRLEKHLNKEEVELNEDNLDSIAKKHGMEFNRTTYGAGMKHKTKGEVSINRYGEWNHYKAGSKSSNAQGDSTGNFSSLDKHLSTLKEESEQLDELNYGTVKSLFVKRREMRDIPSKKSKEVKVNNVKTSNSRLMGFKPTQNQPFDKVDKGTHYELKPKNEDTLDPLAATQSPCDMGTNPNDTTERQKGLSKSARIIKSLYKKKGVVKEDMYDHEKEDKSVQTYGKKPKVMEPDEKKNLGEKKPDARIVMSGGTTLTGEKRDTVEIDPLMKNRPGPDTFGATGKKASQQ